MDDRVLRFRWAVPAAGVRVVRGQGERLELGNTADPIQKTADTAVFLAPVGEASLPYDPLEKSRELIDAFAHETVANQPLDEDQCVSLANEWGLLGLKCWDVFQTAAGGSPDLELAAERAELVPEWIAAITEWRDAFKFWGACGNEPNPSYLTELVELPNGKMKPRLLINEGSATFFGCHVRPRSRPVVRASDPQITPRAPLDSARVMLLHMLGRKLDQFTRLTPTVVLDTGKFGLRGMPTSLLGALWLALAENAAGGFVARRCPRCSRWFLADPSQERRNPRVYCKSTCRVAMSERRGRARELAAEGKKPTEIAKLLGRDVKLIRAWLRESGRARNREA